MKKLSFLIFLAISFTLFQFSCSETDQSLEQDLDSGSLYAVQYSDLGDIGYISLNEGALHNDLVNLAIDHWTACSDDPIVISNEFIRILTEHGQSLVEENNLDFEEFINIANSDEIVSGLEDMDDASFETPEYWSQKGFSSNFTEKALGLVNVINGLSGENVSIIKASINNFYEANNLSLNENDQLAFGMMVDVANHSAELWLGTEAGGQNRFFEFVEIQNGICNESDPISQTNGFWAKLILSDAAGAVGVAASTIASTGGVAGVPTPATLGIPPAGIAGVIGGVTASAISAINNW